MAGWYVEDLVGDVQEEVLETDLNSFDGCHCMQVLDDRGVNGGSHAIGQVAVSAIHVAMPNGTSGGRDVTEGFVWNEAAVQAPGALGDLLDFVSSSVDELCHSGSTFSVDFNCKGAVGEEGPLVFSFLSIVGAMFGVGELNTKFSRAPSFSFSYFVDS